jgi:hypothetical protein
MANEPKVITQRPPTFSPFSRFCIGTGVVLVVVTFFQWDLVEILTPFFLPPLLFLLWAILAITSLVSIIYVFIHFKKNSWKAFLPFLINSVTVLTLVFTPFTSIYLDLEFAIKKRGYEQVIKMVENHELQPSNERGLVKLPTKYSYLSRGGGEIIIDKSSGITSIFFYTYRGILDNASGYMYRSNDMPPSQYLMAEDWQQVVQKEPYWFFCAAY